MSIAEKLITIAEKQQKVYDAGYEKGKAEGGGSDTEAAFEEGKQAENKAMWDGITANNTRTSWASAFQYWGCEYLRPPYVIAPTKGALSNMFSDNKKLKEVKSEHFDFSNYTPAQTANTSGWYRMFMNCSSLETVEDLGMAAGGYNYTFSGCSALKKVVVLRSNADTQFQSTFNSCGALEDITIEGTIGQNGFVISSMATKLSKASILSILNACNIDVTSSPVTITLPSKCIDGAIDTETLLSETGDSDLYNAQMSARSLGYNIAFN